MLFNPSLMEPLFTTEIIIPENKLVIKSITKENTLKSEPVIPSPIFCIGNFVETVAAELKSNVEVKPAIKIIIL